eukprot:CAMPEP_0169463972 /NCGR_PEP_ID=MMETSP1042-20121227/20401_1 /TAXON_ID=464988 /ORGANISM="Hemiselmis andersenii, Strain CCMP1180" /LENGTH=84 /DNA_ID=CAMNT_0009576757 /DNA_START=26 /DNA_END=277 /DNA_ORIENTATION=-
MGVQQHLEGGLAELESKVNKITILLFRIITYYTRVPVSLYKQVDLPHSKVEEHGQEPLDSHPPLIKHAHIHNRTVAAVPQSTVQ